MDALQVGDWVIQYSAGYWKIIKILPKYADFDYDSQHIHWKKGDLIGHWAIVKKAFTPKMKPSVRCECVDLSCCRSVNNEIRERIAQAFSENPAFVQKFTQSPSVDEPAIVPVWMNIPALEEPNFQAMLNACPPKYTEKAFWTWAGAFKAYRANPPASHLLCFKHHLWELDGNFDPILFGASLKKITE